MADSLSHEEFDAAIGGKQPKLPTIDDVKRAAVARGINPDFAVSIMGQESGGNWKTKDSPKGARGGMQVMPGTFKQMMGDDGNPDDPWDNLEAGLRYIDYGRKKLGTDDPKLLAAGYHQGYDTPELKRGVIADTTDGSKRTRDYANEIAARMGINSADGAAAPRELSANPSIRMLQEWETDGHTVSWSGGGDGAPAPVPVDGPKDDGKGAVMRNLGYIGDNLKIGWNTLANAYDGLFAGQYAELYEANKAKFGDNPTDPAMAANQAELKANYDAHMGRVAQRSQESAQMQAEGRPETRQFLADAKDKPFLEQAAQLGDALVKNPVGVITDLGVQSAPASIAMMATAVAARFGFRSVPAAMAGGGAASATVEFGNDYAQQRAEGKSHEDAWTSASIKSGVVGLFDAASMGTAGKALDEVLKAGFGGKLKTIGKELGTQAALGAAGEGLGTLAAGDTPSLSAVAAEAVGEMFSAPGEALTTFRGTKKDAASPSDTGAVPATDVLGTLTTDSPETRPATPGAGSQAPTASAPATAGDDTIAQAGDLLRTELDAQNPNAELTTPVAGDTLARVDDLDARLAAATDPQEAATLTKERARLTANWPAMVVGRAAPFATETGANLDAQYAIVDAGSLTASHDTNLRQNPAYPQSLQPRDRERAASEVQISGIVQKLAPQRLGASGDAANGAPIVGADGLVESGNARTIALQRVYQANGAKAQSYRDWLAANADTFGFTADQVAAIEKPVLVRVRRTPVNRAEFARQANAPTTAVMSTVEQARSDAARIQSLDDLETDESGDFTGAGNRGFVRRFVGGLATTEQAGLIGADGQLSQSGYARIRNAVLARAYGDSPVLQRMVESLDNNLRGITGALMRVAPQVAKARDSIAAGALFDRDITENLLGAVEELSRLRTEGRSVAEYLAQAGMFGDALAPETANLLAFLDANIRSPKRIAEFLQAYLDVLASAGNPNQDTLFGGGEAPSKQDIIDLAKERTKREQDRGAVPDGARGATGADAGRAANDDAGGAGGGAGGDRTGTENRARLSRKAGSPPSSRPDEVTPAAPSSEGVVVSGDTITIDGVEYDATLEGFGQVDPPRTLADDDPLLTDTITIDTPERQAMRDRIVDSFFVGATPVEGRKPILYLMGGGGGSGKGTIKNKLHAAGIIPESGPVDLDADEIKVHHIPEYAKIVAAGDSRAAATVHEESSAIAKRVQRRALEGGYDLIVDGTMSDAAKANALMELARKAGYEVALFGVTVDPRAAIVRAGKRAKRSGRYVPPAALLKAHKGFASIFGELLAAADWGAVFDNTGTEPRPIALKEAASQNPSVVNDSAYNEVIGYGGLNERANRFADVIPPEARRNDGRQGRVEEGQGGGRGRGDRAGQGERGAGREGRDGGVPSERVDPTEALRAALVALPQQTDRPTTPVQPTQAPPSAGLSVSGLRAGISKILAEAKRLPAGGVQVAQSVADLPEGLRDFLRSENAESEVEGIYDPASKTVWLVADHLPTAERAEQVLFHELYGHFGLQGLFGKGLSAALRDLVARNKNLRVAAAKMRMEHGYDEDIANEEALVELAERGESLEGLRRFVAAMQKALRELGFERLADWMEGLTDAEAMTVIAEARRFVRGEVESNAEKGARVAAAEREVYGVRQRGPASGDLFPESLKNVRLPQEARGPARQPVASVAAPDVHAATALSVREAPGVPGLYFVETELVTVGERELPVNRVDSPDEAALAISYLTRYAVEHMDVLVTDAKGKPLAVVGALKGERSSVTVPVSTIVAEMSRIEGAANFWMVHNHPSGRSELSDADKRLSRAVQSQLKDVGIAYRGMMAVGRQQKNVQYSFIDPKGAVTTDASIQTPATGKYRVPVVERVIAERSRAGKEIGNFFDAADIAKVFAKHGPGIVFTNAQREVTAYVPVTPDETMPLRKDGRATRLFGAASKAGAGGAIIVNPDGALSQAQMENLQSALVGPLDVSVYDWVLIDKAGNATSAVAKGIRQGRPGGFMSRKARPAQARQSTAPPQASAVVGPVVTGGAGAAVGATPAVVAAPVSPTAWTVDEPSRLDNIIYSLQDKLVDTRRVLQAIKAWTGSVAEWMDPYLQEELYHGRAAKRVGEFANDELRPMLLEMQRRQVTVAEFEEFLHARHAEERNDQIAKVNPAMPDGGSGMTTADARAHLSAIPAAKRRDLDALAKRIDDITAETRAILIGYGLESANTMATWEGAYKHYVPLMREDMDHGFATNGTGAGFSVRGSASKRATGSTKAVTSIIGNLALQRERAIVRGEKNRVATALWGLAKMNPNPDFWKVDTPPKIKTVSAVTGLVEERPDPTYKSRDNVIVARIPDPQTGEVHERSIVFNERSERAMRMAAALKNLDADRLGLFLGISARITRYFAAINTQYNPVFGIVNLIRDVQGAMFNLTNTPLAGRQAEVSKNILAAMRGVYVQERSGRKGQHAGSPWSGLWEEFQKEGGQTGYRDMFATGEERAKALEKEIAALTHGKLRTGARAFFDWLSDYNSAIENSVRLAAYKTGIDAGLSKQKAASVAKNLTVNFNRKGQAATQVGAMYAFFNASVQGTARLAQTLAGPSGRKIMAGGVMLGAMQALALSMAGFGDDEPPQFIRERNLVIPVGGGRYVSIPMPLGLHVLPNIGRIVTEFALGGLSRPGERVVELLGVLAEAFNPIGSAGMSLQTITPTAVDPLAALAENRDWTGKPIYREDFNRLAPTPGFTRMKDTASSWAKGLAWVVNRVSGGTDFQRGLWSPTPDQFDYLIGQATGGVGREASKAWQTGASLYTGEELPTYKIPLVGRLIGTTDGQSSQANRFYSNLTAMAEHEAEIKGRARTGDDVKGYLEAHPEARLWAEANAAERQVSQLRKAKREMIEDGRPSEQVSAMDKRIALAMTRLNDRVKAVRAQRQ